jgi:hypothetical protein
MELSIPFIVQANNSFPGFYIHQSFQFYDIVVFLLLLLIGKTITFSSLKSTITFDMEHYCTIDT